MATVVTSLPRTIIRGTAFYLRFRYKDNAGDLIDLQGRPLTFAYRQEGSLTPVFEIENTGAEDAEGNIFFLQTPDLVLTETGLWCINLANAHTNDIAIDDGSWWIRWQMDDNPLNDKVIGRGKLRVRNP